VCVSVFVTLLTWWFASRPPVPAARELRHSRVLLFDDWASDKDYTVRGFLLKLWYALDALG
jgi:hypothetical protein